MSARMRTLRDPDISEDAFQAQVIELAAVLGWEHMHVRRSIGKGRKWTTATNVVGWPDLTLWSHRHRRVMFVELKSNSGVVTAEQLEVHRSLRDAGQEVYVWRPSTWDEAVEILGGRR